MRDIFILITSMFIVGFCIPTIRQRKSEVKALIAFLFATFYGMMAIQYGAIVLGLHPTETTVVSACKP